MALDNLALTESVSLRNSTIKDYSQDKALESINKAKSLVMAAWKGENIATTQQVAEFYDVSEGVVRQVVKRHRQELELDGLKVLSRKALEFCDGLSLNSEGGKLTAWTPRATLRLGMLLRDSEVAKSIRDVILNLIEVIPQQNERIRELELENENLRLKTHYMERRDSIRQLHGAAMLALLDGRPDAVIEKIEKVTETIVVTGNRSVNFEGRSTAEVGKELGFKTGREFERWLERVGHDDLCCQGLRVNQATYIPTENLAKVRKVWTDSRDKSRQLIIGE